MSNPTELDSTSAKACRDCGDTKSLTDFNKHPKTRDGRQPHCRDCQRERSARHYHANKPLYQDRTKRWKAENQERVRAGRRKRLAAVRGTTEFQAGQWRRWLSHRYGITPADYQAILTSQGGGCGICGAAEPPSGQKRFHVDHDHRTGKVRGVLCQPCNTMLGLADDNSTTLGNAIAYLEKALTRS